MKRYYAVTLMFYNRMTGEDVKRIEEIPDGALSILSGMEYIDLVRPLILDDLRSGRTIPQCCIRYGMSRGMVRNVRDRYLV